jgi:hypothetical protein
MRTIELPDRAIFFFFFGEMAKYRQWFLTLLVFHSNGSFLQPISASRVAQISPTSSSWNKQENNIIDSGRTRAATFTVFKEIVVLKMRSQLVLGNDASPTTTHSEMMAMYRLTANASMSVHSATAL